MMRILHKCFSKYQALPIQSKAALWFVLCNLVIKGLNFISAPIYTRLLSTGEYGIMTVYNAYQQVLLIVMTFELTLGAYSRGLLKYADNKEGFTANVILLSNFITVIVGLVIFIFRKYIFIGTVINSRILSILIIMLLFQPAYNSWVVRRRFDNQYKSVVFATGIYSVASFVIPVICVFVCGRTAEIKIIASLIVMMIFYFPFYLNALLKNNTWNNQNLRIVMWKYCFNFQLPLVFHSLSFLILGQSDRIMINIMKNPSEAGMYSVAYSVASIAMVFNTSINQAFQPFRYKCLEDKNYEEIKKSTNAILVIMSGIVLTFVLLSPEIFLILFPNQYYEAISAIPPITASVFFMTIYSVFVDIESYYEKTGYIMCASLVCALVNIILNYHAIKYFGYLGCGYTTLISYVLFSIMHYFFMKKASMRKSDKKSLFDMRVMTFLGAMAILLGFTGEIIYKYNLIRWGISATVVVLTFIFRKTLKRMLYVANMKKKNGDNR